MSGHQVVPSEQAAWHSACWRPARAQLDRAVHKIKQCRRVATRYDKLAVNHLVDGI